MQKLLTWMRGQRGPIGTVFSLLWGGTFLVFTFWCGIPSMTPNEWGDWAAGLAAPLAFLWLVLGYLQQGEELRLQGDALRQQADELRASVTQHKLVADATARQAAVAERSQTIALRAQVLIHQPRFSRFVAENYYVAEHLLKLKISNIGRTCHNVGLRFSGQGVDSSQLLPVWEETAEIIFTLSVPLPAPAFMTLAFDYTDEVLTRQSQKLRIEFGSPASPGAEMFISLESMTFNVPEPESCPVEAD